MGELLFSLGVKLMKKIIYSILCAFVYLAMCIPISVSAQTVPASMGKEFYCMVMQNSGNHPGSYFRIYLSSQISTNAIIEITDSSFSQTITITPNIVSTVDLPLSVEDVTNETPTNQAIHILADNDISVSVMYHKQYSSDSYLAFPVTMLGTDYVTVCYTSCTSTRLFGSDVKASEFGIIGTDDSTLVTITPSATGTTLNQHPVLMQFSITLNKGETYLVYGNPTDTTGDLTGTIIHSSKPIAVLSGHDRTEIGHDFGQSRNCLVEQIPPDNMLGNYFITSPYTGRPYPLPDYFRVVAPYNGTIIYQNGIRATGIDAGQFYEFSSDQPVQIQTNNPVIVVQYSLSETGPDGQYVGSNSFKYLNYGWDPTMMIVPSTSQFLSDYLFSNQVDEAFDSNYVNVVIPDSAIPSLHLDDRTVQSAFITIPGSGFSFSQISLPQGSHHITASVPFGLSIYGTGIADAYANFGGMRPPVLTAVPEMLSLPTESFGIENISPNPAFTDAQISYTVNTSALVHIGLYNIFGEEVIKWLDDYRNTGNYTSHIQLTGMPEGSYLLVMQSGKFHSIKQLVVLR